MPTASLLKTDPEGARNRLGRLKSRSSQRSEFLGSYAHFPRFFVLFFFFQAEDGIRDKLVTGVQTCALPISMPGAWKLRWIGMKRTPTSMVDARSCRYSACAAWPAEEHFTAPTGERRSRLSSKRTRKRSSISAVFSKDCDTTTCRVRVGGFFGARNGYRRSGSSRFARIGSLRPTSARLA